MCNVQKNRKREETAVKQDLSDSDNVQDPRMNHSDDGQEKKRERKEADTNSQ